MRSQSTSRLVLAALVVLVAGTVVGIELDRSSSAPATTTTTTAAQPADALWPFASSPTRFTSPAGAAKSFAVHYMGFTKPIVGAARRVSATAAAVAIRASSPGSTTTVLVRQFTSSKSWWVTGATSSEIVVTTPRPMQQISSPTRLRGASTAFEAVVNVDVRQDGSLKDLASTTVMGGSMGVMGPFAKTISFAHPSKGAGAILFRTLSAKDGHVVVASVVRVVFRR